MATLEVVASKMAVCLQVADDRLDGGTASKFPLDDTLDAALLARALDPIALR